ncbi:MULTISPECIES: hypothetical protein [unclassified Mesorhizobium]|nr:MULTISPECIES: hypothetical protein [unclassified Mesorhizobium]
MQNIEVELPPEGHWLVARPRKAGGVDGTTHAADALIGISLTSFIGQ